MRLEFRKTNKALVVKFNGELDEYSSKSIREDLDNKLFETEKNIIILDLTDLSFMDSTGIGMLLGRYKVMKRRNIPIFILNPRENVDKVLKLTGIYQIMQKIE